MIFTYNFVCSFRQLRTNNVVSDSYLYNYKSFLEARWIYISQLAHKLRSYWPKQILEIYMLIKWRNALKDVIVLSLSIYKWMAEWRDKDKNTRFQNTWVLRVYVTRRLGRQYGYNKLILVTAYKVYKSRYSGQKLNSKLGLLKSRDKQSF